MSTEPLAASTLGRTPGALIGRDAELAAVAARFHAEAKVVTLAGPAGVGKSRLSLEYAERALEDGEHTVVARVRGLMDRALVVDALLAALSGGAGLAAGPVEALWERYQGDDILLVLDDVESASQAGTLVDDLVSGYPGLRVLATSLRPLGVSREQVLRVRPFDLGVDVLGEVSPAVVIFAQKAVAANAGFSLGPHNQLDVLEICRRVGGLPLAIELAASRCAAIPVAVMARELARPEGIGLLHDDVRGSTDRHASMELSLGWTYELLDDDERRLLDRLAVFEGTFDLEAALRVAAPDAADTAVMLDRISSLVDVQLVDLDPRNAEDPRFSLPRLVRSYSSRRLAHSGELAAVRHRHARYFQLRCHRPVEPALLPDILVALDRAVADGHVDDGLHAAVAAVAQLSAPGATGVLQSRVDEVVTRLGDEPTNPVLLAQALIRSATGPAPDFAGHTYPEWVRARVGAAVAAARRSGDQQALLEALLLVVRSLPTTMDAPSAFAAVAEGLPLARELHQEAMTARFEMYAAMAGQARGDIETTVGLGTSALRRARASGDLNTELHTSLLLHRVPRGLLEDDLDIPSLEHLLASCERAGETRVGGSVLAALADRALADGALDLAARWAYRLQLVAAGWRLTEPLAATVPLVTLVVVAAGRGDVRQGLELATALEKFESVLIFALTHESLERYQTAASNLARRASPDEVSTARRVGAALTLPEAHDRGVAYARTLLAPVASNSGARTPAASPELTPREIDVLVHLASGATNKAIGTALGLTPKTVMHHSVSIYRKLGVRGRGEATAWAFRSGLAKG